MVGGASLGAVALAAACLHDVARCRPGDWIHYTGVLAFLALAGMTYSKRQNWSYSHFRHQLAIHGLPVTDDEDTWRLPGRTIADDLSVATLTDMFPGGGAPGNQVEAVQQRAGQPAQVARLRGLGALALTRTAAAARTRVRSRHQQHARRHRHRCPST